MSEQAYTYYQEFLTFYKDDDFTVKLEEVDGLLFVHVNVERFTPSSFKRMKALWEEIYERAWYGGYESIYAYTPDETFVKRFGKMPYNKINEYRQSGIVYNVYEWVLQEPNWEN